MHKPKGYNDLYFRIIIALLAAHVIVVYGEDDSVFKLFLLWDYWRSLLFSFAIAFILINIVYAVTVKLDKHFDWKEHTSQRIGLQLGFGIIAPGIIAFILAFIYFRLYDIDIMVTRYVKFDFPFIMSLLLLLNAYYIGFYLYRQWQYSESRMESSNESTTLPTQQSATSKEVYIVHKGTKIIPIPVISICYFYHEGEYNFVRTFGKEDYLISESLEEVQKKLNDKQFFRVNRQMIVSFSACEHIEPLENKKLKLIVKPAFKEVIIISHKRAASFKAWVDR